MSDKESWSGQDEARLARLMQAAPRGTPGAAARARAFEAVHAEWRELQARRAGAARRRAGFAAASIAVAALGGVLWMQYFPPSIASADRLFGNVSVSGAPLEAGTRLRHGARLATAAGSGVLLRYSPDLTLRLDAGTRVTLADAGNLQLEQGRVDVVVTPGVAVPFVVHTAAGDVHHVGTRYVVNVSGAGVEVAVREGAVRIDAGKGVARAAAGELLQIAPGGAVARRALTDDAAWAWVAKLPTPVVIEGRTLAQFLRWYAAETGRRVDFADAGTRARAASAVLHGSVDGLPPAQALAIVVASVDLAAVVPAQGPVVIGPAHH
jgi:transmembrane sensor